jgi:hypothetical protein
MAQRQTKRLSILMAGVVWSLIVSPAEAQTQVDLRTQSKDVDFANAASTRPVKTGVSLPPACGVGELFFVSNAPAGSNLYACVTPNTWALEGGGSGGGGAGAVTVQLDGTAAGTRAVENFVSGVGVVTTIVDTGTRINIQNTADTSVMLSKAAAQGGSVFLCTSASGSAGAYTCPMAPTLATYTAGMTIAWKPDVDGAGGATTLNIDTLGARPVKLADGTTDPTPIDIQAGRLLPLWYDGTVFRQIASQPLPGSPVSLQPTCSAALRGRLWFATGATGVKDGLTVCAKDATEAYAWRTLY